MSDRAYETVESAVFDAEDGEDFAWPFHSLPMAAQLIDHKERILDVSDAWLALTGYARDEVIGRLASSLLSLGSARVAAMEVIPDLRSKGRSDGVSLLLRTAGGGLRRIDCSARLIPHGDGFRVFAVMEPRDDPRENLEDYADATGSWFWEMDANLRFSWVSSNISRKTGMSPDWLVGKTREEVGRPDADLAAWSAYREAVARHEPFSNFVYRAEGPCGPVWVRASGRPVFDSDGTFTGYRGAGVDVTGEIEARAAADAARERLLAALDTTEDIYAIWDRDDRLAVCNDRYRTFGGLPPDRIEVGMTFEQVIRLTLEHELIVSAHSREEDWVQRRMARHRNPDEPFELDMADGSRLLVRERKVANGETVVVYTDVTEQRRHQQSLREALAAAEDANAQRAAFMAQMSHELRTPMNAIIGFAEVIESQLHGPIGDERYLEYIEHIHDSGQHLLSLINDLLDIAKIESGEFILNEEALDVQAMVIEAMGLLGPIAERKQIQLVPSSGARAWVLADRRALRQVLMNLLSNAIKFTEKGGTVDTEVGVAADGELVISVIDTGAGIPPEHLEDVWQPFAQVEDRLLSRPMLGTGLGLSVVRNLMQMHQGDADLDSEVGVGTRVSVRFPAHRRLRQGA
ncbi:MAG: ATP-binding protein [Alphaproteobacteria bacterium]